MDNSHREHINSEFAPALNLEGSDRAAVETAYEDLLGYDSATAMDNAEDRIGYWVERLDGGLDRSELAGTMAASALDGPGNHVPPVDFGGNVRVVEAFIDELTNPEQVDAEAMTATAADTRSNHEAEQAQADPEFAFASVDVPDDIPSGQRFDIEGTVQAQGGDIWDAEVELEMIDHMGRVVSTSTEEIGAVRDAEQASFSFWAEIAEDDEMIAVKLTGDGFGAEPVTFDDPLITDPPGLAEGFGHLEWNWDTSEGPGSGIGVSSHGASEPGQGSSGTGFFLDEHHYATA